MSSPDKTDLLAELHLRAERLVCLAQSTKRLLLEVFQEDQVPAEALAGRWKVNAVEVPYFADEVARQYLRLRETESPETSGVCVRARAVNLSRKQLLANNARTGHTHVGLNTAAAFELYGRG